MVSVNPDRLALIFQRKARSVLELLSRAEDCSRPLMHSLRVSFLECETRNIKSDGYCAYSVMTMLQVYIESGLGGGRSWKSFLDHILDPRRGERDELDVRKRPGFVLDWLNDPNFNQSNMCEEDLRRARAIAACDGQSMPPRSIWGTSTVCIKCTCTCLLEPVLLLHNLFQMISEFAIFKRLKFAIFKADRNSEFLELEFYGNGNATDFSSPLPSADALRYNYVSMADYPTFFSDDRALIGYSGDHFFLIHRQFLTSLKLATKVLYTALCTHNDKVIIV